MRTFLLLPFALLLAAQAASAVPPPLAACDADFQTVLRAAPAEAPVLPAQAVWLDGRRLRWPQAPAGAVRFRLLQSASGQVVAKAGEEAFGADAALLLQRDEAPLAAATAERFKWVAAGPTLAVRSVDRARIPTLLRGQLLLVAEDRDGQVIAATGTQTAGALDDLYVAAARLPDLGATPTERHTDFRLWAPTAQAVWLCLHANGGGPAYALRPMARAAATGAWSTRARDDLGGRYYTYLVDVAVRGVGLVRNRVTDPYSLSLTTDSRRSWIGRLDAPALQPGGWTTTPRPERVRAATDLVVYELHLRDFSIGDATVPAAHRGTYLAFTHADSNGMRHLRALAEAGVTDVHLLPVFDIASVPEQGCVTPDAAELARAAPDSEAQQAAVMAVAARDCFNWGYDPLHYTAPEGSYSTDAADGAVRILEFRRMVQALHRAGLRVGMDMVYNHTSAAGQHPQSVLDRIVPGYYQRMNADGAIERSTCCDNTATEHAMMARLMIDSAVVWARDHQIDSMRFDLMGHQPRAAMERLQQALDAAAGRHIHLLGEGWNFGEVKDGARFVQAAQGRLNGSDIATFSDRARDAFRNRHWGADGDAVAQRKAADLLRTGLAGTLRDFRMPAFDGRVQPLSAVDYNGQPAGYAAQPGEVVNYVENHDNPTLFDLLAMKLPPDTPRDERARIQVLGGALTAFSQGIAYFHAGVEALRSKSLDRNSYDSGDWFNRLDWTFSDNHFGSGLPPRADNGREWPQMKPLLADPRIKPTAAEIRFTRDAFLDLLRIRASSTLFRLRTAAEVQQRLSFPNAGPAGDPQLLVGHLQGAGLEGAGYAEVLYAINLGAATSTLRVPALQGRDFVLHPVHRSAQAADRRPREQSRWDAASATLTVPPRTALVYVRDLGN